MPNQTIPKKFAFVIFLLIGGGIFSGCHLVSSSQPPNQNRARKDVSTAYQNPRIVGAIKTAEINESSGFAASLCQPNVFWTHNDSGDGAYLFALDKTGETLGVWKVENAKNKDWEDLATLKKPNGECFLYIGDIGDNESKRDDITVYLVEEPNVSGADRTSSRKNPRVTRPAEAIKIEYPNGRFNAETLIVHPQTGDLYILTKRFQDAAAVYKLPKNYSFDKVNRLEKIADFTVPSIPFGLLTGGGIAPDGKRVIIADYLAAYELILPEGAKNFDEIWREKPLRVELGEREQGEAITYSADGTAIYATSEKKNSPIIEVRKR